MSMIAHVYAREVLDSHDAKATKATTYIKSGTFGRGMVSSGKKNLKKGLPVDAEVLHTLKSTPAKCGLETSLGDKNGFVPCYFYAAQSFDKKMLLPGSLLRKRSSLSLYNKRENCEVNAY